MSAEKLLSYVHFHWDKCEGVQTLAPPPYLHTWRRCSASIETTRAKWVISMRLKQGGFANKASCCHVHFHMHFHMAQT
jgi:hypothetical protein